MKDPTTLYLENSLGFPSQPCCERLAPWFTQPSLIGDRALILNARVRYLAAL